MSRPEIRTALDARTTARLAADVLSDLVHAKPDAVLALPTGRTPLPLYDELAARYANGSIDFRHVQVFNLDEWVGRSGDTPGSYARFMDESFYRRVNVPPSHRHIPNGAAPDPEKECAAYEAAIAAAGGLDLAVLGIGRNGHIGFNEPGASPLERTHVARVADDTRAVNAYGFPDRNPPEWAYTMGIATILDSRQILLLATGSEKATILGRALNGPITPDVPASILQRHPNVIVVGDRAALAEVT